MLARFVGPTGRPRDVPLGAMPVECVRLMQSRLNPAGAEYTTLQEFPLALDKQPLE